MLRTRRAFTLIELMIVIIVIGILATIAIASYGMWRHNIAATVVENDITGASTGLASYMNFHGNYPPNLAGVDFAASSGSELTLYTNAPSIGVYSSLTPDQNAQLFLNVCNANLNGLDNTACTFAGNGGGAKIHVKGTVATNTIWSSPINQSDVSLPYGQAYTNATNAMIAQFTSQGGSFPITVSGNSVPLPTPTEQPNGPATDYCLEGRSGDFTDIIYHAVPHDTGAELGPCPSNANLHYYPS
ncbi:MAG TPA: type II secretion system protein [Candidatus Saccharimonadaceae bacterium]|nr:type II secretion system protein [Candidatus Saccharimonadaceae bacterium]